MKHSVPHDLGVAGAKKVTESAWESYSTKFSAYRPTCEWQSDTRAKIGFTAKGISLAGTIEVLESSIDLDLDVPFLLKPFRGKAISVIEGEIREWINKSKAGDL
jgi:hypothetical protein